MIVYICVDHNMPGKLRQPRPIAGLAAGTGGSRAQPRESFPAAHDPGVIL